MRSLLVLILIIVLIHEHNAWRRRRRRRCHPQSCHKQWGGWSTCNCLGDQWRRQRVTRSAQCGGGCSLQTQHRKCYHGTCRYPYGYCNVFTKKCICHLGTFGTRCQRFCPNGKYGSGCARRCNCVGSAKCDRVSGYCRCPVGRYGTRCERSYRMNTRKYRYISFNGNTKCHMQERIASVVSDAVNICPVRSHYAHYCLCKGRTSSHSFNLFYGQACSCPRRLPNSYAYRLHRNKYVTYSVCCPKA